MQTSIPRPPILFIDGAPDSWRFPILKLPGRPENYRVRTDVLTKWAMVPVS